MPSDRETRCTLNRKAEGYSTAYTSGFVEGLNNKIKVIKRRCYGITNLGHLYQRICLDLNGYDRFEVDTL
jgi:hypothetical protein